MKNNRINLFEMCDGRCAIRGSRACSSNIASDECPAGFANVGELQAYVWKHSEHIRYDDKGENESNKGSYSSACVKKAPFNLENGAIHRTGSQIENSLYVDFKNNEIMKNGIKLCNISDRDEFLLLDMLLRDKVVHWTIGYVICDGWRERGVKNPIASFRVLVSRLNSIVTIIEPIRKTGMWKLTEKVQVSSSIEVSEKLLKDASSIVSSDCKGALVKVLVAMKQYQNLPESYRLLIDIHKQLGKSVPIELLENGERIFRVQYNRYLDAINSIKQCCEKSERRGIWSDAEERLRKLNKKFKQVSNIKNMISVVLDAMTGDMENTVHVVCRQFVTYADALSGKEIGEILRNQTFENIINMDIVKKAMNTTLGEIIKTLSYSGYKAKEEIQDEILLVFGNLCYKGVFKTKSFRTASELKSYLVKRLTFETIESLIGVRYSISKDVQKDIRTLKKIADIDELSDSELISRLGQNWNKERINKARCGRNNLYGHISVDDYWKYFEQCEKIMTFEEITPNE